MEKKLDLTLTIITLNEEDTIERCIRSVPFAKEIIVVDSGSKDKTKGIAETFGAKFYHQEWLGFGAQKKLAVERANSKWVLCLDADEWLSNELKDEIMDIVSRDGNGYSVFTMKRLSRYLGDWIRHGGWFPDKQVRLFKKGAAQWDEKDTIHESVKTKERIFELSMLLYHEPFNSIKEQVDVNFKYAHLIAEKKFSKGKRIHCRWGIYLRTCSRFMENFILRGGFRDGIRGFIIAVNSAQSYMVQMYHIYQKTKNTETM